MKPMASKENTQAPRKLLGDNIQSMAYIVFQSNFFKVRFYKANGFQRKYASATVTY